ncbi:uncharacterized protein LOC135397706 [Ornithodoros turicata]|uniref:uncharacterized protein LOC135397706 n=1 Tax=Ornithodoros turicata TaxID=34597 RepID=UPI00313900DE
MAENLPTTASKSSKKSKSSTKKEGKRVRKANQETTPTDAYSLAAPAQPSEEPPALSDTGGLFQGFRSQSDAPRDVLGVAKYQAPSKAPMDSDVKPERSPDESKRARDKTSKPNKTIRAVLGMASVTTLLATIILVVRHYWRRKGHSTVSMGCHSAVCRSIIDNITAHLDKSIEPCNDFYGFVCNKWWNLTGMTSFMEAGKAVFYRQILAALESPTLERPNRHGMHLLGRLYTTCMRFLKNEKSSLKDIVNGASKYLNISDFLELQNFTDLVLELVKMSLMFGIHTTFALNVRNFGNITYFSVESYRSLEHKASAAQVVDSRPYQHDAHFYIEDVARSIDAVFNLSNKLALQEHQYEVIACDSELSAILNKTGNKTTHTLDSIVGLLHTPPIGEIVKLLNSVIPNKHLQPTDTILVTGPDIIAQAQDVLASKPIRTSVVYSLLSILEDVSLPYVLKTKDLSHEDTKPFICVKVTQGFLRHTWPYLMSMLSGFDDNAKTIETMGLHIRDSAIATNLFAWMDDSTRKKAHDVLAKLEFYTFDRAHLEALSQGVDYSSFELQNDAFVDLYFRARAFERKLLLVEILSEAASVISGWKLDMGITYMTEPLDWIVVPIRFQGRPLYYPDLEERVPFYINYATLGALIAREIVRATDQKYIAWSPTSQKKFTEFQACLNKVGKSLGFNVLGVDSMDRSYGSLLAYEAIHRMLEAMGVEVYENNWSTARDFFFVRSCMMSCSKDGGSIDRQMCLLPVYSNPGFSNHFHCVEKGANIQVDPCVGSLFRN